MLPKKEISDREGLFCSMDKILSANEWKLELLENFKYAYYLCIKEKKSQLYAINVLQIAPHLSLQKVLHLRLRTI